MIIVITTGDTENKIKIYNISKSDFDVYRQCNEKSSMKRYCVLICEYNKYYYFLERYKNIKYIDCSTYKKLIYDGFNTIFSLRTVKKSIKSEITYYTRKGEKNSLYRIRKYNTLYINNASIQYKNNYADKQILNNKYISRLLCDDSKRMTI